MEPIPIQHQSPSGQLADYYLIHYDEIGPTTSRALRDASGVSDASVRKARRIIARRLAPQGKTLVEPQRQNEWKFEQTSDQGVHAHSTKSRITAITNEAVRMVADNKACSVGNATLARSLEEFKIAFETILASLDS